MIKTVTNQAIDTKVLSDNTSKRNADISARVYEYIAKKAANATSEPDKMQEPTTFIDRSQLDKFIEEANRKMDAARIERRFEIDDELNRPIVKIIDKESKEVVAQIPTEVALKLSKSIGEMLGLLTDERI